MEYPFGCFLEGLTGKTEKAFVLFKHSSARAETLVSYQYWFGY